MTAPVSLSAALVRAPLTIPCPYRPCRAPIGGDCVSSGGWHMAGFHAARRRAVAHLTDAEKVARVTAMRDGQELRRKEVSASLDALYADPVRVAELHAGWERQREAWAEINRQIYAEEREARDRCTAPFHHRSDCRCREPGWTSPAPPPDLRGRAPVADLDVERARRMAG